MKIFFINVGYGDSILIEHINRGKKYHILIDGGQSGEEHYNDFPQRIKTIEFLRERAIYKIDLLVITHLHEDHVGGLLEVVQNIEIDRMWCTFAVPIAHMGRRIVDGGYGEDASNMMKALNIFNEISCILTNKGSKIIEIVGTQLNREIVGSLYGDIFCLDKIISQELRTLLSEAYTQSNNFLIEDILIKIGNFINNTSIVMRLNYNNRKVLLTGDVYATYWTDIIARDISIKADILKLSHHGHLDGLSEAFIRAVEPEYVVVSTSNNRTDNCPNPMIMELFNKHYQIIGKKVEYFFTDAVHMPPYSTHESKHRAVMFDLECHKIDSQYL